MRLKESILWVEALTRGYRMRLIINILLGGASVGFSLLFIWLSKSLIDDAVAGSVSGEQILLPAVMIVGTLLAQQLCAVVRGYIESYTSTHMMNALRERLFYRVMLSLWSGKERFHTGDITTRLEGDVRKVCETICMTIPLMAISAVELFASFLFMMSLDSRIAWVLFLIMPISLLLSKRYMMRLRALTHSIREVDSEVQSHIQEQVQHRNVINAMGHTIESIASLRALSGVLLNNTLKRTNYTLFSRTVVRLGFAAGYLTAFLWGVEGLSSGAVSFGVMTAFLQLVAKVQLPIVELSSQLSTIAQSTSSIDRLGEIDSLEIEEQGEAIMLDGGVGIRLCGVTFSYGGREVLRGFDCDFSPNKLHVIVGPTGSGKSTILRLILGFLNPMQGAVEIYNDASRANCSQLTRDNFVYIPQGNTLISGTIRDNITLSDPLATDEQIESVIHTAVAEFIYDLPDGLDTICGEQGAGLSEGEAQRIAIARGLLRKGGVILLDEPTSALDSQTEERLIERLVEYAQNRTLIMVTHRERSGKISPSVVKLTKE